LEVLYRNAQHPLEEIFKHFDGESAILGGDAANEKSRQLARGVYPESPEPEQTMAEIGEKAVVSQLGHLLLSEVRIC
jgi:hypothetical protein